MIEPAVAASSLGRAISAARDRARAIGRPVLLSRTDRVPSVDPAELFARGQRLGPERTYWERPNEGTSLVGLGAAWSFEGDSVDRFRAAARAWQTLLADAVPGTSDAAGPGRHRSPVPGEEAAGTADLDDEAEAGPLLLGGFAFDPTRRPSDLWRDFPAARLALPRLLLTRRGDRCWLTVSQLVGADAEPAALSAALERDLAALRAPLNQPADAVIPHRAADFGPRERDGVSRQPTSARPAEIASWLALSRDDRASCARRQSRSAETDQDRRPRRADALPAAQWRAIVAQAAAAIQRGQAEKIVLARAVEVDPGARINLPTALRRLRVAYPTCAIFAFASGDSCFLGATPERLVRLTAGEVRVSCLAGTTARGRTAEEDERLGADLLASHKNREEHAFVVRELAAQLACGVTDLDVPPEPVLMRVRNVQHLYTPLRGRLAAGGSLLELVERLHPTPAVGGRPRETALRFIRERERLDRGWYAGPVGWVDARGDGEFVVALRSAVLGSKPGRARAELDLGRVGACARSGVDPTGPRSATLFAGCGIVAESDPAAEYAESELKLAPMLTALGGA